MSLNPATRTEKVEVLFNPDELAGLDAIRKLFGIGRSTLLRGISNSVVDAHRTAPPPGRESGGCPGPGRLAGRSRGAKGAKNLRRTW